MRFDLGFHIGTDANTAFTIGGDYLRTWINDRGGEIHGSCDSGARPASMPSFYQPLDAAHRWFVESGWSRSDRSRISSTTARRSPATGSRTPGASSMPAGCSASSAELRAGIRSGGQSVEREIGSPELPEISGEGYGGLSMRYIYDTRDRDALWQRGTLMPRDVFPRRRGARRRCGPMTDSRAWRRWRCPFGENVAYLRASGGSSFDTLLPIYDTFTLGGPVSMPGLSIGELRGTSYWSAQASYLQSIADISYVFGQSLYAGFALTAADMSGRSTSRARSRSIPGPS